MGTLPIPIDLEALSPDELTELVRAVNVLYFRTAAWDRTTWMGHKAVKCPMDAWAYQELVARVRPDVVVETGSHAGGSALFFAHLLDALGHGQVVSVDVREHAGRPDHPRITWLTGDSVAPGTLEAVRAEVHEGAKVLVILDASHRRDHVLAELRAYAPLVSPGSYCIVEDTAFDAYPAWPAFGPGPAAAVAAFLEETDVFEVDHAAGAHLISLAPGGFLRRVG